MTGVASTGDRRNICHHHEPSTAFKAIVDPGLGLFDLGLCRCSSSGTATPSNEVTGSCPTLFSIFSLCPTCPSRSFERHVPSQEFRSLFWRRVLLVSTASRLHFVFVLWRRRSIRSALPRLDVFRTESRSLSFRSAPWSCLNRSSLRPELSLTGRQCEGPVRKCHTSPFAPTALQPSRLRP